MPEADDLQAVLEQCNLQELASSTQVRTTGECAHPVQGSISLGHGQLLPEAGNLCLQDGIISRGVLIYHSLQYQSTAYLLMRLFSLEVGYQVNVCSLQRFHTGHWHQTAVQE